MARFGSVHSWTMALTFALTIKQPLRSPVRPSPPTLQAASGPCVYCMSRASTGCRGWTSKTPTWPAQVCPGPAQLARRSSMAKAHTLLVTCIRRLTLSRSAAMPRKMAPNWYGSGRSSSLPTVGTYLTTPFGRLASPGTCTKDQTYSNYIF